MPEKQAVLSVYNTFFERYMTQRSYTEVLELLDEDFHSFGTGRREIALTKDQQANLWQEELQQQPDPQPYKHMDAIVLEAGQGHASVFGTLMLHPEGPSPMLLRVLAGFVLRQDGWRMQTMHSSFPSDLQDDLEFFPCTLLEARQTKSQLDSLLFMMENVDMGFVAGTLQDGLTVRFINSRALAYMGYSKEEFHTLLQDNVVNFAFPEDRETIVAQMRLLGEHVETLPFCMKLMHKDGHPVWLSGSISCMEEGNNQRQYIYVFYDCTQEKLMRDELHLSNERFQIALSHSDNIIFEYDPVEEEFIFLYGPYERYGLPQRLYGSISQVVESTTLLEESRENCIQLIEDAVLRDTFGSCELRSRLSNGSTTWDRVFLSKITLKDNRHFKVLGIVMDITIEREVSQKFAQEEQYRNTMKAQAMMVCEANLTTDQLVSGFELYASSNSYSHTIHRMANNSVHGEDRAVFLKQLNCSALLSSYRQGITEVRLEYRLKYGEGDDYTWVSSRIHLLMHPKTRDIHIFCYVRNINSWKRREEELRYQAERDLMTGLYNKITTERLASQLLDNKPSHLVSALMVLDLDNFKLVNDRLGHLMGDAILSEIAHKLQPLFSENDIIGRIGGDEFAIFVRDVPSQSFCEDKARQICDLFLGGNAVNRSFTLTLSVGIALSPPYGKLYTELYEQADAALYTAKSKGKGQFYFYNTSIVHNLSNKLTEVIDNDGAVLQKNFHKNVSDYLFRILHTSSDLETAVNAILQLLSLHFSVSRGYIFEYDESLTYLSNTYEWCDEGVQPQKEFLQNLSSNALGNYERHFEQDNLYILTCLEDAMPEERALLEKQGIHSMLQCGIRVGGRLHGFLGFDECQRDRTPLLEEIDIIQTAANILGGFLVSKRNQAQVAQSQLTLKTIIDNLDNYTYVIDPHSYQLLYFNRKTTELVPNVQKGNLCHKVFRSYDTPCPDCPMALLKPDSQKAVYLEIYNTSYEVWTQTSASWIDWIDGRRTCLLNCVDITESKKNTLRSLQQEKT